MTGIPTHTNPAPWDMAWSMNAPIRARYLELRADEPELLRLLATGAGKAHTASAPTLAAMYERMGFVRLA